jgi:hypothetical protein
MKSFTAVMNFMNDIGNPFLMMVSLVYKGSGHGRDG